MIALPCSTSCRLLKVESAISRPVTGHIMLLRKKMHTEAFTESSIRDQSCILTSFSSILNLHIFDEQKNRQNEVNTTVSVKLHFDEFFFRFEKLVKQRKQNCKVAF